MAIITYRHVIKNDLYFMYTYIYMIYVHIVLNNPFLLKENGEKLQVVCKTNIF